LGVVGWHRQPCDGRAPGDRTSPPARRSRRSIWCPCREWRGEVGDPPDRRNRLPCRQAMARRRSAWPVSLRPASAQVPTCSASCSASRHAASGQVLAGSPAKFPLAAEHDGADRADIKPIIDTRTSSLEVRSLRDIIADRRAATRGEATSNLRPNDRRLLRSALMTYFTRQTLFLHSHQISLEISSNCCSFSASASAAGNSGPWTARTRTSSYRIGRSWGLPS
jgi:hypothetical protein